MTRQKAQTPREVPDRLKNHLALLAKEGKVSGKEGKRSKTMKEGGFRASTTTEPRASCAGGTVATLHLKSNQLMTKRKNRARVQCISAIISVPHHSARRKEGKGKEEEKKSEKIMPIFVTR